MSCDPLCTVPTVKITSRGIIHQAGALVTHTAQTVLSPGSAGMNTLFLLFTILSAIPASFTFWIISQLLGDKQVSKGISGWSPLTQHQQPSLSPPVLSQTLQHTPSQILCQFLPDQGVSSTQDPSTGSGMGVFAQTDTSR